MAATSSTERIEQFFNHLATLKGYAKRVVVGGRDLNEAEEEDRLARIREYIEIGISFDLTQKEMVTILYREMFVAE